VNDILYRALARLFYRATDEIGAHDRIDGVELVDKVIEIDQSPIGRTPRSNAATYTGLFTFIRELFAMLPEARARGFRPGRFSFNVKGGRCEACQGDGVMAIEMHFLPNVYVTCEECKGRRYNRETLEVKYRGKSIAEVLDLTVGQAATLLENFPPIANKLRTLQKVGLGYLKLGQSATTLSGGEAQRVKLARELSRRSTGRTLYILDEPTTGLHFEDTRKLLDVLNTLVDQGNTVVVIEHNLDVIKSADHIIDLGPEGGDQGGRVVATGTPEELAASSRSFTGRFLAEMFRRPNLRLVRTASA
jgi:excinuclease ABC subunit A